jgi:hypothetical protein
MSFQGSLTHTSDGESLSVCLSPGQSRGALKTDGSIDPSQLAVAHTVRYESLTTQPETTV